MKRKQYIMAAVSGVLLVGLAVFGIGILHVCDEKNFQKVKKKEVF